MVVGAVALGCEIAGLTDSKKLTKKRREALNAEILEKAAGVGLGWVHADELDELGIAASLVEATKRALSEISVSYHEIIIDGTVNFLKDTGKGPYVTTMKKADLLVPSVSAASIVAKVARDRFMEKQIGTYPEYGFDSHVGYGTAVHRAAIEKHGVTPLHRLSFAPLQKYQTATSATPVPQGLGQAVTTTKRIGDTAEEAAAEYLQQLGHEIVERNWKTKICEIDIVSWCNGTTYFTEVKYRKNANQGGGIAAITSKKLKQMTFAAEVFTKARRLSQSNQRLAAITVIGEPPVIEQFLEI